MVGMAGVTTVTQSRGTQLFPFFTPPPAAWSFDWTSGKSQNSSADSADFRRLEERDGNGRRLSAFLQSAKICGRISSPVPHFCRRSIAGRASPAALRFRCAPGQPAFQQRATLRRARRGAPGRGREGRRFPMILRLDPSGGGRGVAGREHPGFAPRAQSPGNGSVHRPDEEDGPGQPFQRGQFARPEQAPRFRALRDHEHARRQQAGGEVVLRRRSLSIRNAAGPVAPRARSAAGTRAAPSPWKTSGPAPRVLRADAWVSSSVSHSCARPRLPEYSQSTAPPGPGVASARAAAARCSKDGAGHGGQHPRPRRRRRRGGGRACPRPARRSAPPGGRPGPSPRRNTPERRAPAPSRPAPGRVRGKGPSPNAPAATRRSRASNARHDQQARRRGQREDQVRPRGASPASRARKMVARRRSFALAAGPARRRVGRGSPGVWETVSTS